MAIRPYVKINPSEKPSEYLARVQSAGSDGGTKITKWEARENHAHLGDWEREKFARLTTLPSSQLTREIRAIKEMQKLPKENFNSPLMIAGVLSSGEILAFGFLLIVAVGNLYGIYDTLGDILDELKHNNSSPLIDTLETKLKELDAKLARGEIKKEDYEKERRKIIEEVIRSH